MEAAADGRADEAEELLDNGSTELVLRERGAAAVKAAFAAPRRAHFHTLSALDLARNALQALPAGDWAALLPALRVLDLSSNALSALPERLPATLEHLALQDNRFTAIPPAVFELGALVKLGVGGNRLTTVDGNFAGLRSLKMFYAGCNEIASVSDAFGAVGSTLEVLYLGSNRLVEFPPVIAASLTRVAVLTLSHNSLTSVPASVANLHRLSVLHLHQNKLRTLPVELLALRQLRQLSVRDNPLVDNFADECAVLVPTLRDLTARACYRRLQAEPAMAARLRETVPQDLWDYLSTAHACSSCNAVCFGQTRASQVEFLDLCGQYHIPFTRYLCSTACPEETSTSSPPRTDAVGRLVRLRRVLLDRYAPGTAPSVDQLRDEVLRAEQEIADWGA